MQDENRWLLKHINDVRKHMGLPPLTTLNEMELRGNRTYWHGSFSGSGIETGKKAIALGDSPAFFFTTHFGYALSYLYQDFNKLHHTFAKYGTMVNEIDVTDLRLGTVTPGYLYPLALEQNTNVFDSHLQGDARLLFDLISKDERLKQIFHERHANIMDFCQSLMKRDWFNIENESNPQYVPGISRNDIMNVIHGSSRVGVVFHGVSNFEIDKYPSIGIFKDKMSNLKQAKPYIVRFHKGIIVKETDTTGKVIEKTKDVIRIGYENQPTSSQEPNI